MLGCGASPPFSKIIPIGLMAPTPSHDVAAALLAPGSNNTEGRMRYALIALTLAMFFLAGCQCATGPVAPVQAVAVAAAAPSPCSAPPAAAAPTVQYVAAAPVAVQYRVGAAEVGKAVALIPANVVICLVNGIKCAIDALFPTPVPTPTLLYALPPQAAVAAPAPCAPPAALANPCAR